MRLLALALVVSCTTPQSDPDKIYRKNMRLDVNGKVEYGIAVMQREGKYLIKANFYRKSEVIIITTCHREIVIQKADDEITYDYYPAKGIEDTGLCPMEIGAFDSNGQHSWGYIDFVDDEKLEAVVGCNGKLKGAKGASVCQSKSGLIQTITFLEPVTAYSIERCDSMNQHSDRKWSFPIKRGKCVYAFSNTRGDIHRLTTIGYDEVLIR